MTDPKVFERKKKSKSANFAMIGRVYEKHRLLDYGHMSSHATDRYPIKFEMTVRMHIVTTAEIMHSPKSGDSTAAIKVVVWNGACRQFFPGIRLGDIVLVLQILASSLRCYHVVA